MNAESQVVTDEEVYRALRTVIDPEVGMDIVTLGLVYDVAIEKNAVRVVYSLTTPGCPMEHVVQAGIENAVGALPGVDSVEPELVWEPAWSPDRIQGGVR